MRVLPNRLQHGDPGTGTVGLTPDEVLVEESCQYARGLPMQDGSFAADSIWVNIVNLHAEVVAVDASTLRFSHHGEAWTGHLQPDTVARYSMRAPSRDLSGVSAGQHVQIVDAWRPGTNEVDVSTLFA